MRAHHFTDLIYTRKLTQKAMEGMGDKVDNRFALLIDADNISAKYIKPILDELSKYGNITYKRIYGDWTSTQNASWKEELLKNSISPIQQFSYTHGKNATDSAMIIDAMDILYTNTVDGFCLVSSDSDFTRLAGRLRETGLTVIGMGEDKTPAAFRKACDIFTTLELLIEDTELEKSVGGNAARHTAGTDADSEKNDEIISKKEIEEAIIKIITENQNSGKETGLGEVGSRLVKLYPDFDVRSYGYSLLSKFLGEFSKIKTIKDGNSVFVTLYEDISMKERLEKYIVRLVKESGKKGIELGTLGQNVHDRFGNFKVRDYGYSQFNQYIKSIPNIEIKKDKKVIKAVYRA